MGRVIAVSTITNANSNRQPSSQKPKPGNISGASDSVRVVVVPPGDDIMSATNSQIFRQNGGERGQNPQMQEDAPPPEEIIRAPKKYCCSSSPQTECKIWAIVDIVLACLIFIILVNFTATLKTNKEFLEAIIERDKENERDLKRFLDYSPLKQDLVLTVAIGREIFSILLGALLYVAAKSRIHHQLRIWLGTTFVVIVIDLFLFIPKVAFTQNKFIYVSSMIGYFLYKWYEVWMTTLLFKEIRQQSVAQTHIIDGTANQNFETESEPGYMDNPPGIRMGTGMGKQMSGQMGMGGHQFRSHRNGVESDVEHISGHFDNNMGNFVLTQPPKRISFHSRPEIMTRVEAKSPVHVEQLQSYRY